MKSIRRNAIVLFLTASFLPSTIVLTVSAIGIFAHEQAMKVVARTYVQDLAETVALRYEREILRDFGGGLNPFFSSINPLSPLTSLNPFDRFAPDSFRMPGWVALINRDGQIITSSPEIEALEERLPDKLPLGVAREIRGKNGDVFTVAIYPAGDTGWYVLSAVSWEHLMGPLKRFSPLWMIMALLLGMIGIVGAFLLWKWLVSPLRAMENEMSTLRWGEDSPSLCSDTPVDEICRLRSVFFALAQTAIEKRRLLERSVFDMFRVQEEERIHLAREIHDGPLQGITALMQQIRLAQREPLREKVDQHLHAAEESARMVVRELRGMCDALSPPWIDLGLFHALTELGERLSLQLGVSVSVDFDSQDVPVPKDIVLALFRIFQEAVSNAVQHGKAKEINVRSHCENDRFFMEIEDNGRGFTPPDDFALLKAKGHRGLANMAERVKLAGGEFYIQSSPEKGTLLRCVYDMTCWEEASQDL